MPQLNFLKIGLDIMGGDNSPDATLKGAYLASQYLSKDESIVLVGNEKLAKVGLNQII